MNNRLSVFVVTFPAARIGIYVEASLDEAVDGPICSYVTKSMKSFQ